VRAKLIVITGGSGAGKSTLAKALQEALLPEIWLHFSIDSILYALPPSVLERGNLHNDWSAVDGKPIAASAYACANTLLAAGNNVIFDCVVTNESGARKLTDAFAGHQAIYVGLTCPWDVIKARTAARGDRTVEEAEFSFRNVGNLRHDYTFDTSRVSAEAIARQLSRERGRILGS